MPKYTLHRNYTLRTKKGHTIGFVKDVPVHVPPMCEADAIAIGARPVEGEPDKVLGAEKPAPAPLTPEERQNKIYEAFNTMLGRNERLDFGANGMPNVKRLSQLAGVDVDNNERDTLWREFSTRQADDE